MHLMAILVTDHRLEERLKAEREVSGADRYDEVWEGIYMITPMPTEHQYLVARMTAVLLEVIGGPELGMVCPGVNLSREDIEDWTQDYRVADVAVLLPGSRGKDCDTHWRGGADFLIEVASPGDRTREKIPFHSRIGVVELLLVDRESWTFELYRREKGQLHEVGRSSLDAPQVLSSAAVLVTFQLVSGDPRPQIRVTHVHSGRQWVI
jgi:Uma2 family endonuclease